MLVCGSEVTAAESQQGSGYGAHCSSAITVNGTEGNIFNIYTSEYHGVYNGVVVSGTELLSLRGNNIFV